MIEGQYTVLKLKRMLMLNQLMDFSKLMQATVTPHKVLIACEDKQQLDKETEDVIRTLFDTIKHKPNIKIIFSTRSGSNTDAFLHNMGRRISRKGFVRRVEHLNWSDLTSSSQEKLLERSVQFQGATVSLNELMSIESPAAKFLPLGALREDKKLVIADPVPNSNGYNESYYIGRTLRNQKAIKQDIFNDSGIRDSCVYLASTEEEYTKLCQLHPKSNIHWVEKDKSGKLVWQQSQGTLETVRRHIDTDSSHTYTDDDLDKLLEQAEYQRVMLISDTAGMGKSTVLTHLSKQIKQKFPAKWVVRIDLNDHTDALNSLKKGQIEKEKVTEFVSDKLLKLKPGLELELFKPYFEKKPKVGMVIMLDGFDEISPFYKETVIDLLQALRQTAVEQLWVTTRPHLREELEDKLQQLSYTLEPFSEDNQVEFLTKFWSLKDWFTEPNVKGEEKEKGKVEIYAEKLIKKLSESISDRDRQFTGIPLQSRMLAEAFDEEVRIFYESAESKPEIFYNLDLLGLYETFIERKHDIFQEEKFQVSVNNAAAKEQREHDLKSMRLDHQLLALKMLFNEEQVALCQKSKECSFSTEKLTRIGIVQIHCDGKPHFIHRTFAEYYVADCLVNSMTEGINTSEQVVCFILEDIFLKYDYRVIRVFVDCLLTRTEISKEVLKQYGNQIQNMRKFGNQILQNAAREDNANIIEFLLDSVQADHRDTIKEMLLAKDSEGFTTWLISVVFKNTQVLEKLWEWAGKNLTTEEMNNTLLFAADYEGMTAWHWVAEKGNLEVLLKIWEWAEKKLTTDEINKLLLGSDNEGRTAWHWAAHRGHLEALQNIYECANEKLTTEEINYGLLLGIDRKGRTAWHWAAETGNLEVLHKIWEWAEEKTTTEEINIELLLGTDFMGKTAWHVAAEEGNLQVLHKIWEWAEEKLTTKEIYDEFLLGTDIMGMTAWHWAAGKGNLKLLHKIWEWAEKKLTTEEINKLLLSTDNEGRTAWHMAASCGHLQVLHEIWTWAKEKLTSKETNNKLLLGTDRDGKTAWHWAAGKGNLKLLHKIWEWAEEKLTTEEICNKLLLGTDSGGRTSWHLAAGKDNLEILHKIWEWAEEKLTTEEINNKMLLGTDKKGKTAWHWAAERGNLDILKKLWEGAEEKLTTEEINNKLLLGADNEGRTSWHWAAEMGNLEILQKVLEWAEEKLTTEEINNKLLLGTDKKGRTAWHLAAEKGNFKVLHKIWEWAEKKLTTEDIYTRLLLGTDSEGRPGRQLAAKGGNLEVLHKIWDWAKEKLTTEDINNLFGTGSEGSSGWQLAAEWFKTL